MDLKRYRVEQKKLPTAASLPYHRQTDRASHRHAFSRPCPYPHAYPLFVCPACRVVSFRTGLQKADEQLISLMMNENEGRSSYVVVVTKCDKVNDTKVREGEGDRRRGTAAPFRLASTLMLLLSFPVAISLRCFLLQ